MRAAKVDRYGPPEVIHLEKVEKPEPEENELLIRVHAASVIRADTILRSGKFPGVFWLPARLMFGLFRPRKRRLGIEFSGVVEAVGEGVLDYSPGDQVTGTTFDLDDGAYADYICVPESRKEGRLAKKPDGVSHAQAAACLIGGLTAKFFFDKTDLHAGQKVLIYGASGSVGSFAVQLAKLAGAEVTGVCSTDNLDFVRSLGADHVIDYTKEDFAESGVTFDIIFDTVGKAGYSKAMGVLKEDGHFLLASSGLREIIGMLFNKQVIGGIATEKTENIEYLLNLIDQGKLTVPIERTWPLEEVATAHAHVDTERKQGNVVIEVS